MNILVLGMGSNVSQGIVKAIRNICGIPITIIGACLGRSSVGLYLCDEAIIMPAAADDSFIQWYIETCNKKHISITFTGVEENIDVLINNRELLENSCNTCFVFPDKTAWDVGFDKYKTCEWLRDNDIPYPKFALASNDKELSELITRVGFPLIAKPRSGKCSSNIVIANSLKDLISIIGREDYVIQECIGHVDNEYTVGCYFSKQGVLKSSIIMHRYLKNGGTSMAEIIDVPSINQVIQKIADKLYTTGPLNIQLRLRDDGTPVCFEWNVRYSGTTAIRNHFGFRDVEAAIREYVLFENIDNCFSYNSKGTVIRVEDELYFENRGIKELMSEFNL